MGQEVSNMSGLAAGTGLRADLVARLALAESSGSGWRLDLSEDHARWTPGIEPLLDAAGADGDEIGRRLRETVKPLIDAAHEHPLGHDLELVHRFDHETGSRWTHFRARGYRHGTHYGLVGVATDVTAREQSDADLADLTDRYRLLVDLSPE